MPIGGSLTPVHVVDGSPSLVFHVRGRYIREGVSPGAIVSYLLPHAKLCLQILVAATIEGGKLISRRFHVSTTSYILSLVQFQDPSQSKENFLLRYQMVSEKPSMDRGKGKRLSRVS